jgi:hypothetical protein
VFVVTHTEVVEEGLNKFGETTTQACIDCIKAKDSSSHLLRTIRRNVLHPLPLPFPQNLPKIQKCTPRALPFPSLKTFLKSKTAHRVLSPSRQSLTTSPSSPLLFLPSLSFKIGRSSSPKEFPQQANNAKSLHQQ